MRKAASGKKPSLFRKLVLGPIAPIVAAIIGGIFSLISAVLPRALPPRQPLQYSPAPFARFTDHDPIAIPSVPTSATTEKTYEDRLAEWLRGATEETHAGLPSATPKSLVWVEPFPAPSLAKTAPPSTFEAGAVASSLAQAEARSPARTENPRRASVRRCPNLTHGVWTIFASKDSRGTVWNNSTLKITSQHDTPDGLQIAGFLDWRANGKRAGREYVVGNYVDDTRSLFIEGRKSAGHDRDLALSACSARLSEDERRLIDGTWGSASAHRSAIPGRFEARR